MRDGVRGRHGRTLVLLALTALTLTLAAPAAAQEPAGLAFGFEDGVEGWSAPDWLAANDGAVAHDDTRAVGGDHSLALPVDYPAGGGWEQAGAAFRFPDAPVDLLAYESVTFWVYAPVSGLFADLVFNDPWNPPTGLRALEEGWNQLSFDLTPASADWPGGVDSANEFLVRVVAQNLPETYQGPVWIDDLEFTRGTAPLLRPLAPRDNGTVSAPPEGTYTIEVEAGASPGRELRSVTWSGGAQEGSLTADPGTALWSGEWDVWAEEEGVTELTITATDNAGESTTAQMAVLVRNSEIEVEILAPAFDSEISGDVEVRAAVTEDPRFVLEEVMLYTLENDFDPVPMELVGNGDGTWEAAASLDTTALADGVATLAVEARDERSAVRDLAHVIVRNTPLEWDFVGAEGTRFTHAGEEFSYVGWNEYELFTTPENFGRHQTRGLDYTIFGEVLEPGTELDWEEQIDRQMLEAARNGQTVLRTWAFNRNDEDSAFQRMVDGEIVFQESTFRRLDYVMDSARRHGIRVILTLDNYWEDYGGISRAAQWLGLDNKLQFFTAPAAIDLYQDYAEHLLTRVNTVNGSRYAEDPTVFAWELMNEPRTDCAADPTPDHQYCDPTGAVMRQWISDQAEFIHGLAPEHMVSAGGEAHGWIPTPGGGIQYGGADEGNNNIPFHDMDVEGIDFLTFHPYPNASWAGLTREQTRELVVSLTRMGVERGKPVVMEEYGIQRSQPVFTEDGTALDPGTPDHLRERLDHYEMMLRACYANGCAGSNVWMLADWSDRDLNVNLYRPGTDAERDADLVSLFRDWSGRVAEDAVALQPPSCEVGYTTHGGWPGGFNAQLWVSNTGDTPIDGWELAWWFEGGQEVRHAWNVTASQEGALVTAGSLPWNRVIAPGGSQSLGLVGAKGDTDPAPRIFTLNGEVCASR